MSSKETLNAKWFPHGATWAKVAPGSIAPEERRSIMEEEDFGYCEGHQILYRKAALHQCVVYLLACKCDDPLCTGEPKLKNLPPCNEW